MIDLSDYYSGGYFIIRANKPDWPQLQTDLLPEKLISLSRCMCPRVEVYLGFIPGDRDAALRFGIPQEKMDEFLEWCGEYETDLAIDSAFHSPEAARRFIERFLPDRTGLFLIGAGLQQQLAASDWYAEKVAPTDVPRPPSAWNLEGLVAQHMPLAAGGVLLGFEVICYGYNDFQDSMHCSYTAEELKELFGIQLGQYGLIETREEAQRFSDWIAEDEQQGHRGEPLPYAYWLLVSYPLTAVAD